ncbi:MAG: GerMN domain-containing protein [bacterium]|nr:MAG: GerMN domain-containing protein [bacterium]
MKRIVLALVAVAFLAAIVAGGIRLYRSWRAGEEGGRQAARQEGVTTGDFRIIDLYFNDAEGRRLALEAREIPWQSTEEAIRQSLEELIAGPTKRKLAPAVPGGVRVREVFLRDGVAYVDLTAAVSENHPGGSWSELLTVYALVNTITENFPEVDRVQLLIEGKESETLAGHIDISRPLAGRVQLLAGDW